MSTQANVVLRFFVSGQNSVSGVIDRLTLKKKELAKPATVPIDAEDNASVTIKKVREEADALNKKRAEIPIGTNSSKFKADILAIDMRLEKLNRYLAAPDVELDGLDHTLLGIHRISAALDKLNGKTAHVKVSESVDKSLLSRIFSRSGSGGGAFSGPFKGVSGVGAGGSAAAIEALTSPVGASAAALALPFLGTGLAGGLLGGLGVGLAGLGIAGAVGSGKTKPGDIAKAQRAVQQAALRVQAAQLRLSKAQAGTAGTAGTPGKPGHAANPASILSARATLLSAQNALRKAKGPQVAIDQLRVQAAQTRLAQLLAGTPGTAGKPGKPGHPGSPASIASAQAALFAAQTGSINAKQNLSNLKANANTAAQQNLRTQFSNLAKDARGSLATIGQSFVPVMSAIVKVADSSLKKLTPIFAAAEKTISGPFKQVGVTLMSSLASPAVVTAVQTLAKSFGQFLTAFTPQIPGIVNALANGITGMATAFTDHPGMIKGMASVLAFLFKLPGFVAASLGSLTRVTSWLISGLPHAVSIGLDKARELFISIGHTIETVWNHFWDEIKGNPVWDAIRSGIKIGWAGIVFLFKSSIGVIVASWNIFWSVILNVAKVIWTLVKNSIKGIWDIIAAIFKVFTDLLTLHWTAALNAMKNLGTQIWNLTKNSLSAIWNAIRSIAIGVWNALKSYLIGIWNNMRNAVVSSWNAIKNSVIATWHSIVSTGKSIWNDFFGWLRSGWRGVVNSAKTIWNDIKGAVSTPVKWVVNNVWDRFAGIINTATNFLHLGKPLPVVHMAGGGKLPGYGGGDRIPALLEAGETVIDKKRSRMYARVFAAMGVPGYASGGIAGGGPPINLHTGVSRDVGAGPGLRDILNVGKTLVQGAVLGIVKPAVNGILGLLSHMPGANSGFGKMMVGIPKAIANKFFDFISGKDKAFTAQQVKNVGSGVARWAGLVAQVLAMEGLPQSLVGQVLRQISSESGGNPNAINLTDINAQRGDPSRGLLQTIGSTFRAYHWPGTSWNIYDPKANIAAAINYARHVYGPMLMSGGRGLGSGSGYKFGTNSASPGWHWINEGTPNMALMHFAGGEKVIPAGKTRGGDGAAIHQYSINVSVPPTANPKETGRIIVRYIQEFEKGSGKGWRS